MTRERAKRMDQTSFWTLDPAAAPGKLRGPPMASREPGRMLAFAPFQGLIRGMSDEVSSSCSRWAFKHLAWEE